MHGKQHIVKTFRYIAFLTLWLALCYVSNAQSTTMTLASGSKVWLGPSATMTVDGTLLMENSSTFHYQPNTTLWVGGDWTNNGVYGTNSHTVTFFGDEIQYINGSTSSTFWSLILNKTANDGILAIDTYIQKQLNLIKGSLELNNNDLYLVENANVLANGNLITTIPDVGDMTSFNADRCILNIEGSGSNTYSGRIIKQFSAGTADGFKYLFPYGTPGRFTPALIEFIDADFNNGARIVSKVIPREHPSVEESNASLKRYWVLGKSNINVSRAGATVKFRYYDDELPDGGAFIADYRVLWYYPSYNDPYGYWRIDPGYDADIVDYNVNKMFYSQAVNEIDGDWTIGEEQTARVTYFARQSGSYTDPLTWSKIGFNGDPITSPPYYPTKRTDMVRIQDHKVTVSSATISPLNLLSVETGTGGRASGTLTFLTNTTVTGDTMRVEADARLDICHPNGITLITSLPDNGMVQTAVRELNEDAIYNFIGTEDIQTTGDAIPSPVKQIGIYKEPGDSLKLSKPFIIKDKLILDNGIVDLSSHSINGDTPGRTFVMNNGEFIIRSNFPSNYTANSFTSGTITFDGSGNTTIPSSGSTPGVEQYNYLRIGGVVPRADNITFSDLGEIRISKDLDLSSTTFSGPLSERFITENSTVHFNGTGSFQNIPIQPGSPLDSIVNLQYYNLRISGSGRKMLFSNSGNPTFIVRKNLTLESSTFSLNGNNLEVQGNWNNTGGILEPGTSGVIFRQATPLLTNTVTSRSVVDNPFYQVLIAGQGIIQPNDNIYIGNDLKIEASAELKMSSNTMTLLGNWYNAGGKFTPGTSSVYFKGTSLQNISKTSGSETFYNFFINNGTGINASAVGANNNEGVFVNNQIDLTQGNINVRGHFLRVEPSATIIRGGPTPGHVDGPLRKYVNLDSPPIFEVGNGVDYTPVSMTFTGSDGTNGFLSVSSNTVTAASNLPEMPISFNGASFSPSGSNLHPDKSVLRQWTVRIPPSGTFTLGTRKYNVKLSFINPKDIRNGAQTNYFEGRLYANSRYYEPYRFGYPKVGEITSNSLVYQGLSYLGTLLVGESKRGAFYSIADGNWNNPSSWSTQGYGGAPSSTFPTGTCKVYIGDGKTITLTADRELVNSVVTIDSSGRFMMQNYVLSGAGSSTFYLFHEATLGIGNANGITTAPTASGNLQFAERNYNKGDDYVTHNRGHFIYTGTGNQVTGSGLPNTADSLKTLTIDNTGADVTNIVTLTNDINVIDSLHIKDGQLNITGKNLALKGNWRITSDGSFNGGTNNETVSFTGQTSQTVSSESDLTFRNLTINKPNEFTFVQFAPTASGSNMIYIMRGLNFPATNNAYINLSPSTSGGFPNYGSGEWALQIDQNSNGITRTGAGHIMGELREWMPATIGDHTNGTGGKVFHTGTLSAYNPFTLRLSGGSGSTAGYLGMQVVNQLHPDYSQLSNMTFNYPAMLGFTKYWRLTKPSYSSFSQGTRRFSITPQYLDPEDIPHGSLKTCYDISFWSNNWTRLTPISNAYNDGTPSWVCADRLTTGGVATYSPRGTNISTTAYNLNTLINFGTYSLTGRTLLGDFVVGQQGPPYTYFYSAKNGDWTDPSTWVTGSYTSGVNNGSNSDPSGDKWPKRRNDIAVIGNGYNVNLNASIGWGYGWTIPNADNPDYYEQRLAGVVLETYNNQSGTLTLNTNVIRTNVFNMCKDATLIVGATDGVNSSLHRGSIISPTNTILISRDYNYENHNSGNFVYKAQGRISETWRQSIDDYCRSGNWRATLGYIARIEIDSSGTNLLTSISGKNGLGGGAANNGFRYYSDRYVKMVPNQNYTLKITMEGDNFGTNRYRAEVWIDANYNADWSDETPYTGVIGNDGTLTISNISLPSGTDPGTTRMRILVARRDSYTNNPCFAPSGISGEVEDYTVIVVNPKPMSQEIGEGLPDIVGAITITTENDNSTVTQTQENITCTGNFVIQQGDFVLGSNSLSLERDFINNSGGTAFSGSSGTINFIGDNALQHITGNSSSTFGSIFLEKTNGSVELGIDAKVENELKFNADNLFKLGGFPLYLGKNITEVGTSSGACTANRMIQAEGSDTTSRIVKEFEVPAPTTYKYRPTPDPEPTGYCIPSANSSSHYIRSIRIGNSFQNDESGNNGGYYYFNSDTIELPPGTYDIQLRKNNSTRYYWYVYVDVNRDGVFSGGNEVNNYGQLTANNFVTRQFTIPANASKGCTRLRVKMVNANNNNACQTGATGEFEDYLILIPPDSITVNVPAGDLAVDFLYPIGVEDSYHPAYISVESSSYSSNPSISVGLVDALHPQRYTDDMLDIYWPVRISGIYNLTGSSASFNYYQSNVIGNEERYIPAKFNRVLPWILGWENNLGLPVGVDVDNDLFFADNTPSHVGLNGDWSAGTAPSFFIGRNYYSIASGSWTNPENWSNYGHQSDVPSSYYPGQLFQNDTVHIDGHTIMFNSDTTTINYINIGGTNNVDPERGILQFDENPIGKHLTVSATFTITEDGVFNRKPAASGKDTLSIRYNLYNDADDDATAGMYPYIADSNQTVLRFLSPETSNTLTKPSSTITGEGNWGNIGEIILEKSGGLSDTLYNISNSFSAATVGSPSSYIFKPRSGVLSHQSSTTMSLSGGTESVAMGPFSAFDVQKSALSSKNSLITNVNTAINLDGGSFYVGDGSDENLTYQTGTTINVANGKLDIAGALKRNFSGSTLDFIMGSSGETRVMSKGNTSPSDIGFDISNSSSSFSMGGGRIIVAKGKSGANPTIRINAGLGLGMIGGTIQLGDSSIASAEPIKVGGTMPVWDIHSVGAGQSSQMSQEYFTIKNNWYIDDNNTMELRGNTVELQGNFYNSGLFDPITGSTNLDRRLVILSNPSSTQTLYNKVGGGLQFFNLRIDKSGGLVKLDNADNSNLIVNGTLEFTVGNKAVIDARTGGKYVELSPSGGSSPNTLRVGEGYVDGRMCRYIEASAPKNYYYDIGSNTYTPADFRPEATITNGGYVCIISYPFDHPHLTSSSSDTQTNIQRYWNVNGRNNYNLDNKTYQLTTQWSPLMDDRGGIYSAFEHKRYSRCCPDPPDDCLPEPGTWYEIVTPTKTPSYITSTGSTTWGDFVVSEPVGKSYYSIQSLNWTDPNAWSVDGYRQASDGTLPGERDFVFIGDGKTITIPENTFVRVRSVRVEKGTPSYVPGKLFIVGSLEPLFCQTFILEDEATLGIQHLVGIAPQGDMRGAVQSTITRAFGVSNYVYDFYNGSQSTGTGLPLLIASLQAKNSTLSNFNSVMINNPIGSDPITVRDSILIFKGKLSSSNRNLNLKGNFILANNGQFVPLNNTVEMSGSSHTVLLGNQNGLSFYNLRVTGGDILLAPYHGSTTFTPLQDSLQVYVNNRLTFNSPSRIITRTYDRELVIRSGGSVVQNQTGFVDGTLQKPVAAGTGSTFFEIGNGLVYTPARIEFTSGSGTFGSVEATNYSPVPNELFLGNRMDPVEKIDRWWRLEPQDGFTLGNRKPNVRLQFPYSDFASLGGEQHIDRTIIRRESIPIENPLYSERKYVQLSWNVNGDGVQQSPTEDSVRVEIASGHSLWDGLGDFFIGKKYQRTFYSRQSGNWSNNNTWSFISHTGTVAEGGEFPNMDPLEIEDDVRVGGTTNHVVTMQPATSATISCLDIYGNAKLDMNGATITSSTSGSFTLGHESFEQVFGTQPFLTSSADGFPEISLTNFGSYYVSLRSTVEYDVDAPAVQNITGLPFAAYPAMYYGNIMTSGTGTKYVSFPTIVRGDATNNMSILIINAGTDAFSVRGNVINSGYLDNNGIIEIGTP